MYIYEHILTVSFATWLVLKCIFFFQYSYDYCIDQFSRIDK